MDPAVWFTQHFESAPRAAGWALARASPFDYRSRDGRVVLDVRQARGVRDLVAGAAGMAAALSAAPELEEAILVLGAPRIAPRRLAAEWAQLSRVLRPELFARMRLLAVGERETWHSRQPTADTAQLQKWAEAELRTNEPLASSLYRPSQRSLEVWKLLLRAWLRSEGPLEVGQLVALSGVSHPTVTRVLRRLEFVEELTRHRDRSVQLSRFPKKSFAEYRPQLDELRQTRLFADRSGQAADPRELLSRVRRLREPRLAVSGVIAAEHFDPSFDLIGIPRVDLVLHAPDNRSLVELAQRVDPALRPTSSPTEAVLALHALTRPSTFFEADKDDALQFADPVEAWLDLQELELDQQAQDFVLALRKGKPT